MPSMKKEDEDNFIVLNGKLYFIGKGEYEREIAKKTGIDTSLSNENFSIEDLKVLAGSILPLGKVHKLPENDKDEAPKELVGKRLYTKNIGNDINWDMVIDYNDSNEETGRWGSGYYLLVKGEYEIDEKIIKLENDYIIDYRNSELMRLSERYEDWNIDSTLGTKDGLVLNLDSTNFEDLVNNQGFLDSDKLFKLYGYRVDR